VASAAQPCGGAPTAPAHYHHVVWIWMENHTWGDVFGNSSAPYLNTLAGKCGTDSDYAAVGSPSLPNYLGATSGSTQAVFDDGDPSAHNFTVDNLFRQVRTAGGTERSFVESMPSSCSLVSGGSYAAKHNPAVYYVGGGDRTACQSDDLPFSAFSSVVDGGPFPTFTSITPNLCDDMHDCPVATGDQWLATWVPKILDTASYRDGSTALFIVWDEPTQLANVVVAPGVRPGTVSGTAVNHYSLLRATEEMLGLPLLGQAATATDLRPVFGI
jgi:Phosphoesterase family